MREIDGYLTYDDFATHTSEWVDPITTNYRGYDVYQIGGRQPGNRGAANAQHPGRLRSGKPWAL